MAFKVFKTYLLSIEYGIMVYMVYFSIKCDSNKLQICISVILVCYNSMKVQSKKKYCVHFTF